MLELEPLVTIEAWYTTHAGPSSSKNKITERKSIREEEHIERKHELQSIIREEGKIRRKGGRAIPWNFPAEILKIEKFWWRLSGSVC